MDPSLVRASKFLSLVLRHRSEHIGITVDAAGRGRRGRAARRRGARIRASQGHSVAVELGQEPQAPPDVLFHATATRFLDSIRREGLRPGSRTHVHLSADDATARTVGQRHGKPAVLRIDAGAMHRDGHPFFRSANGVWLTQTVPAYIGFE